MALVLALALSVPAMAFTDNVKEDAPPFEVDVYLVEFEDDEFFGLTGMPPSDRGYAKNEIVAAITELFVPKAAGELKLADYSGMEFTGDSVSFDVTDNKNALASANLKVGDPVVADQLGEWDGYDKDGVYFDFLKDLPKDKTYKWMFFAKVTGDDASITATLKADASAFEDVDDTLIVDDDYVVTIVADGFNVSYWDGTAADDLLFFIETNDKDKTTGLTIYQDGTDGYEVVALKSGMGFLPVGGGALLDPDDSGDKAIIRDLMAIYNDVFVDVFGFDFDKIGGVVDEDTFLDIVGSDDVEATVEIKPWTAYVTVPDNIVVDPPKTGDAASIVGFVMIVLAAAAVVAVKKVRA